MVGDQTAERPDRDGLQARLQALAKGKRSTGLNQRRRQSTALKSHEKLPGSEAAESSYQQGPIRPERCARMTPFKPLRALPHPAPFFAFLLDIPHSPRTVVRRSAVRDGEVLS